jgi:hypothetical protein
MEGLGDVIEKVVDSTGISYVVKKVAGKKGCGCAARKAKLNELFPFKQQENGSTKITGS